LKIVGECREVGSARASMEAGRGSAPQLEGRWQLAHAVLPSAETRVSQKSARPRRAWGASPAAAFAERARAASAPVTNLTALPVSLIEPSSWNGRDGPWGAERTPSRAR